MAVATSRDYIEFSAEVVLGTCLGYSFDRTCHAGVELFETSFHVSGHTDVAPQARTGVVEFHPVDQEDVVDLWNVSGILNLAGT